MQTRRDFIKSAGAISGAAGMLGAFPESVRRAFAIEPSVGSTFLDAEHVVILMQENRSFDHLYGTLSGVRGFNDPRAVTLPNGNPVWLQTNAAGQTCAPFRLNMNQTKAPWLGCLPHTWASQVDARNHGKHDNWLNAKRAENEPAASMPLTMGYCTREDAPFYYALADAFTICDQHFCSSLTGTMPNRLFLWSGTIRGENHSNAPAKVRNGDIEYESSASWKTFPETLSENQVTWKVYQNELSLPVGLTREEESWLANFGDNPLEWFSQYHAGYFPEHQQYLDRVLSTVPGRIEKMQAELAAATPGMGDVDSLHRELKKAQTLLSWAKAKRERWKPEDFAKLSPAEKELHERAFCTNANDPHYHQLQALHYRDGDAERSMNVPRGDVLHQFRQDVDGGKLPAVSWIVAPENYSDHPDAAWYGAWYISQTLDILTRDPEVWKKTIFILTYDENDGYFDHVPPFVAAKPGDAASGTASKGIDLGVEYAGLAEQLTHMSPLEARESPIGLGFRVPMVIASPWTRGGQVCSQIFDHTSVLQFLEKFASAKSGKRIEESNISAWRRAVCGDLTSAFRKFDGEKVALRTLADRDAFHEAVHATRLKKTPDWEYLSVEQIAEARRNRAAACLPRQEAGTRTACALPYELYADAKHDRTAGVLAVSFSAGTRAFGERSAGSAFHVYSPGKYRWGNADWRPFATWAFAVAPGDGVEHHWPLEEFEDGVYHLHIHGPNGFYREYKGRNDAATVTVKCGYQREGDRLSGAVELSIGNDNAGEEQRVEISDMAYGAADRVETIPPGGRKSIIVKTQASGGWYDVRVRVRGNDNAQWRYAGRVETGDAGLTDPAMAGK